MDPWCEAHWSSYTGEGSGVGTTAGAPSASRACCARTVRPVAVPVAAWSAHAATTLIRRCRVLLRALSPFLHEVLYCELLNERESFVVDEHRVVSPKTRRR